MVNPSPSPEENGLLQALSAIGRALSLMGIYGPEHFRTRQAVQEAWRLLAPEVKSRRELQIGLGGGQLVVDGKPVDTRRLPLAKALESRLIALKTTGFSLHQGLGEDEFQRLMVLLFTARVGNLEAGLKESPIKNVRAGQLVWKSALGETGRPQQRTPRGAESGRGSAAGAVPRPRSPGTEKSSARPPEPSFASLSDDNPRIQQIIAFLKGDVAADTPETRQTMARFAGDADQLAALILKAATIHTSPTDVSSGESLADVVIGCLRRAYEGMRGAETPASSSRKPELRKALLLLESNILRRLHDLTRREDPAADARISKAIETLSTEAEIDMVAAELLEHRKGIERAAKRLRQYIRSRGEETVEPVLKRAGLPETTWRQLVIPGGGAGGGRGESPAGAGGSGLPDAPAGLGALALALERFEALMRAGPEAREEADRLAGHIRGGVESAMRAAETEVQRLGREIERAQAAAAERRAKEFSHRELIETLAEIAQDLLQPLTVINCSLSMTLEGHAGKLTPEQENLLRMAQHSGDRLHKIMQHLIGIVGYPTRLTAPGPANRV